MTKSRQEALLEYRKLNPLPASQIVSTPRFQTFKQTYRDDRVAFVHDCFEWPELKDEDGKLLGRASSPAPYQNEIFSLLDKVNRLAVRGPRGLGKSAGAALMVLHFALTHEGLDWKCPTTAPSWRQLTKYLWPEIHKWARRLKTDVVGRGKFDPRTELMQLNLKLDTGDAFALASDDPGLVEGAHADHMLFLFDEAKHIPAAMFDALEGAFSTPGEIKVLAISTPNEPSGRFYDIHARKAGYLDWEVRHVKLEEVIAAGRIPEKWVEDRRVQWGEKSAIFQNHVLGEFANSAEDGIIPLSWVIASNERHAALAGNFGPLTAVGVDVGRGGDATVRALRHGDVISKLCYIEEDARDTMKVCGHVIMDIGKSDAYAVVDVLNCGAGVYDRLKEQGIDVRTFGAGESDNSTDSTGELGFLNKRAAAWWRLRERLDPSRNATIALPPDENLIEELTTPKWWPTSVGRIQVESKDDIRKKIKRSTDAADAVIMSFYDEPDREIHFY